jgi:hypothetical protein
MWLTLDDLRCPECGAFVHPLLDACPACDAPRRSRRPEAAVGSIGAERLIEAPETQRVARDLTLRYTIKVNSMGSAEVDTTLVGAVARLADALTYRVAGDAVPATDDARVTLHEGSLIAQSRVSGALLAEIPLAAVVGGVTRHGEVTLHYAEGPTPATVRGAPGAPGPAGLLRLTVSNRRGLLASKARDDHFEALARWLVVLAAAAAERRWIEVGLPAYLAELGLAAGGSVGPAASSGDAEIAVPAALPEAASRSSVGARLVELESLRAAGLVAEDEYAAKRREILARL